MANRSLTAAGESGWTGICYDISLMKEIDRHVIYRVTEGVSNFHELPGKAVYLKFVSGW